MTLYFAVLNVVRVEYCQFVSHANAIVCAQGCAFCFQPFAVHVGLNGIFMEVEIQVYELVADHVYMALQYDCGCIFHTLGCRFGNKHVASLVYLGVQIVAFAKLHKIFYHLFLVL